MIASTSSKRWGSPTSSLVRSRTSFRAARIRSSSFRSSGPLVQPAECEPAAAQFNRHVRQVANQLPERLDLRSRCLVPPAAPAPQADRRIACGRLSVGSARVYNHLPVAA